MNISIIIPNYNGEKLLQKNLPKVLDAVRDYKGGEIEIIVPDDPSTDNSRAVIKNFIEGIKEKHISGKTIENRDQKKAGFSNNVNRGVGISTGEILILFNSDVYPKDNFLPSLLKQFKDPLVIAVGCQDESYEDGKIVLRGRGLASWQRGFLMHKAGSTDKKNTFWVSGGSGAFRKSIWDKLGGFDPIYDPFYWEDIDLSYRAQKSGYKILFEPDSVVTHEHESGVVKSEFSSSFVKKIAYRNQLIFVWKNITDSSFVINHILWLPYHIVKTVSMKDYAFVQGMLMAIMKLPMILNKRTESSKRSKLNDSEIVNSFKD